MSEHLINDLPSRVVGGFRAARGVGEGWIPVEYETVEYNGTGLAAGARSEASELILDLDLAGRYVLHFALGAETALRVWLDGDPGCREFVTQHGGYALQECALHTVDLTGKRLHIQAKTGPAPQAAFLSYIRAVPAPPEHASQRNLIATNDGFSWVALDGIESERDVWKFFEPLRNSDFGLMLWGPGGADYTSCHRTGVGTLASLTVTDAFRLHNRTHATQLKAFLESGGDILKTAVAAARDVGVKIHFYIRPEAFYCPFPYDGTFRTRFIMDHPQFRCQDEFGDEIMRLSYAFPEVQNHMLEYMEELLSYSPDGLCFAFNRSLPMMICEAPVLQEYERLYGRQPDLPDETDSEEMGNARAELMNGFLERARKLLDSHSLEFSAIVSPDVEGNLRYGLDLMQLAESRVLDAVMLHNGGFHAQVQPDAHGTFWKTLSTKTRVYPNGWGGSYDHVETARFLKQEVFERGFAGGFFWDTENFSANPYNWHPLRCGGSLECLSGIIAGGIASPRVVSFTRLRGAKLGRYNPGQSY